MGDWQLVELCSTVLLHRPGYKAGLSYPGRAEPGCIAWVKQKGSSIYCYMVVAIGPMKGWHCADTFMIGGLGYYIYYTELPPLLSLAYIDIPEPESSEYPNYM